MSYPGNHSYAQGDAVSSLITLVLTGGVLLWLALKTDTCRPDQKGQQRVLEVRGSRVEECNGVEWVPFRREAP